MKTGLILEGGAMRGLFTAGVMDVMMEAGIAFDGAIGVSAGAAFGCNYKSRQIGRVVRYNIRFCRDRRYCGVPVLLRTGDIYSADFCYGEVPLRHDVFDFEAFGANPMEFHVVCTDVETGEAVYHRYEGWQDGGFEWIRASASMPVVSRIVEIEGRKLLDGGIADAIPVRYFESIGYDRNVVILTQPMGYRRGRDAALPLMRWKYRAYPKLVETLETRHTAYNETLAYIAGREARGDLLVIRPERSLPVKRVERNPERLKKAYALGRDMGERRLREIAEFLRP